MDVLARRDRQIWYAYLVNHPYNLCIHNGNTYIDEGTMSVLMARTVSARLPDELDEQFDEYLDQFDRFPPDRSEVVREALKRYFEEEMNGPGTAEN